MKTFLLYFILLILLLVGCGSTEEIEIEEDNTEELLRIEVMTAVQNGRYASALRLLSYMPDFPEATALRTQAEYGIFRQAIIRDIEDAFILSRYESILEILDNHPRFNDRETGFQEKAMNAMLARDNAPREEIQDTIEMLSGMVNEMFQITTLEIDTRNMTMTEVIPGGFMNPGTITLILEFDSTVRLGVANPESILMRTDGNVINISRNSIQIDVLESSVRNFRQVDRIRSNPLVSFTEAVNNQIFEAQTALEQEMAARFVTDVTIESARRTFMNSLEGFMRGLGFDVIWE